MPAQLVASSATAVFSPYFNASNSTRQGAEHRHIALKSTLRNTSEILALYSLERTIYYYEGKEHVQNMPGLISDSGVLDRDSASFASFQSLEDTAIRYPRRRLKSGLLPKDPTSLPWLEIVESYTQRNLSVTSVHLGVSAVAQRLVSVTGGNCGGYYTGIWKERFFEQLLWNMSSREIAKRPVEYRALSWSWAAVDGRSKWP
ncbi:hypothetical protein BDV96DRAFT_110692 [Lophiotrema nucula]|uniref:Uncharacterized protein n=1 Tax=Lophiotrema nucula TaxID=690887 RepID=A0A6A5Z444_9PLEO|nr:hypothetical protein BDV96DRAFT_110692 [Lophiotrema nucula]